MLLEGVLFCQPSGMANFTPPRTYSALLWPLISLAALAAASCCFWMPPAASLPILADFPGMEVGLAVRLSRGLPLEPDAGGGDLLSQAAPARGMSVQAVSVR